jgi:hypothetical protein
MNCRKKGTAINDGQNKHMVQFKKIRPSGLLFFANRHNKAQLFGKPFFDVV